MVNVYYIEDNNFIAACPDAVVLPDISADLSYKDGYTFIVGSDKNGKVILFISSKTGDDHYNLNFEYLVKNGRRLYNTVEGRFFKLGDKTILSIWNDFSSEEMKTLKELFKQQHKMDISNWLFVSEFDEKMAFTCTVNEFISLGLSLEWGEHDKEIILNAYEKSNKLQPAYVKSTNGLGFSDRDYMRHYLYQEGKINESRATDIVYHFTHNYLPIIKTDELYLKPDDTELVFSKRSNRMENKYNYCFSTTRRKNDKEGYSLRFSTISSFQSYARFTLDGWKINNNKNLISKPYNWFYYGEDEPSQKQEYINILRDDEAYQEEIEDRAFEVQSEDRVWSTQSTLPNFSSLVTRVDILIVKGQLSKYVDVINKACNESKGDWRSKIYIYTNRNDFNAQNNNCFYLGKLSENKITIEDIKYMVNEVVKKMQNYDILYRGGVSKDCECIWLTTSKEYAELYGEVQAYEVPIAVLDNLACEDDAMEFLIDEEDRGKGAYDTEEFYLYDRELFDIEQMKKAGYTGYYYHEDEYKCVNVCLFRDFEYRLVPEKQKPQI